MKFSKSYRLLEFVNRKHGWITRHSFGIVGWVGALVTTRSPILAHSLRKDFISDKFDIAARKALRYTRYVSKYLNLFNDQFFDFTVEATEKERRALEKILCRKKDRINKSTYISDLLYIRAADIHDLLEHGSDVDAAIEEFYDYSERLMEEVKNIKPSLSQSKKQFARPESFDSEKATQVLVDLTTWLPLEKWPWYITSGTLLGLHREGDFIKHDLDMDIGFNSEDIHPEYLIDRIDGSSIFHIKRIHHQYDIEINIDGKRVLNKRLSLIQFVHENGVQVDAFLYKLEQGKRWHGSNIHNWQNTPYDLLKRQFKNVSVYAPANADLYLTECYGEWRTPKKSFDCNTDTPNLRIANNFLSLAQFMKKLAWSAKNTPNMVESHYAILNQSGFIDFDKNKNKIIRKI